MEGKKWDTSYLQWFMEGNIREAHTCEFLMQEELHDSLWDFMSFSVAKLLFSIFTFSGTD